ncbi:outer membrane protein [Luminiphilus syltensis NOR5-1B]|uniref:Outer membrane protein n=1 Tax=Luminiphilus syltensis NOR5-1B TaxID=565045 RepID=B8KUX0_9GAMM|nr:TonB-dependent receptor [Luminiphilus syltensis]EED36380.1 outer membrane protein [Luminiphilus syltensis NOR5-1B]
MSHGKPRLARSTLSVCLGAALLTPVVQAQDTRRGSSAVLLEEVVVTARKREESGQDVPIAISAFNSEQLDALKVRNLTDLAVGMPNVVLDEVGTWRGYANFSIRGLALNSGIPSIDPTVGVLVDGVYLGSSVGVVFDTFDLESIEVLRGPQGTLFGRNVTAGAVLLNTRAPDAEFGFKARGSYEVPTEEGGGGSSIVQAVITGGLTDTIAAKLAVYVNDDEGALENQFDGSNHGAYEQLLLRPSIAWRPTDTLELIARYEYQDVDADGPSGQTHTNGSGVPGATINFDRDSFGFSIDNPGYSRQSADFFNLTANWDVWGGTVTNVFGVRSLEMETDADIDSQPRVFFNSDTTTQHEQISNELRYNGRLLDDRLELTTGVFLFESELKYDEDRLIGGTRTPDGIVPGSTQEGGGILDVRSLGVFVSGDYDLTDKLTLSAGLRWTKEEKDAQVATVSANVNNPCYIGKPRPGQGECIYDFTDDESWSFVSPRLGAQYALDDQRRVYAHWSVGYRSGSYNLRNTEFPIVFGPGPFDEEKVDNFEIGYKSEWARGQLNVGAFFSKVKDMQREVNLPSPTSVVLQLIQNTADADIYGVEAEGTFAVTDSFTLKASLGYLDAEYTAVAFDINGDGVVDDADKGLRLPRAPDLTWSLSGIYDIDFGSHGYLSSRVSYGYRDDTAYTDNNLGFILEQEILDVALDFHTGDGHWILSLFGRNLLNTVRHGNDTQLPSSLGGTFAPLGRPATVGVQASYTL